MKKNIESLLNKLLYIKNLNEENEIFKLYL